MFKTDVDVREALERRGLPFKPCGLNADWCVSAWHLSKGEPNTTSGDFYLLDTEKKDEGTGDWLFSVVQRNYPPDDEMEDAADENATKMIIQPGLLNKVVKEWSYRVAWSG